MDQPPEQKTGPRIGRIIAATVCYGYGVLALLGGLVMAGMMIWGYSKRGFFHPDPEGSAWNSLAVTPLNVARYLLNFPWGVSCLIAGRCWWKGKWKIALVAVALAFSCGFALSKIIPYTGENSYKDPFLESTP